MKRKTFDNLQVGDIVTVRTWEEMLALKGTTVDDDGDISITEENCFCEYMRVYEGKRMRVTKITAYGVLLEEKPWYFTRKMLRDEAKKEEIKMKKFEIVLSNSGSGIEMSGVNGADVSATLVGIATQSGDDIIASLEAIVALKAIARKYKFERGMTMQDVPSGMLGEMLEEIEKNIKTIVS